MVEYGGLEPSTETTTSHSTIPDALRSIAQGAVIQLADGLDAGDPVAPLELTAIVHGLAN